MDKTATLPIGADMGSWAHLRDRLSTNSFVFDRIGKPAEVADLICLSEERAPGPSQGRF